VSLATDLTALARFALVGIGLNAFVFLLYLVATSIGLRPIVAATVGWLVGLPTAFLINRTWTFRHTGERSRALMRYGFVYAAAFCLNIVLLAILVDAVGLPHDWVQGFLIAALGLGLFAAQRTWVFQTGRKP
jgi:putative flippase GtrA